MASSKVPFGVSPWTRTEAAYQLHVRSKDLPDLPYETEEGLVDDYYNNPSMYTAETLLRVRAYIELIGDTDSITLDDILEIVRI